MVAISTGNGFETPVNMLDDLGSDMVKWKVHNLHPRLVGDHNGDEMVDLIIIGEDKTYVAYSTGRYYSTP